MYVQTLETSKEKAIELSMKLELATATAAEIEQVWSSLPLYCRNPCSALPPACSAGGGMVHQGCTGERSVLLSGEARVDSLLCDERARQHQQHVC